MAESGNGSQGQGIKFDFQKAIMMALLVLLGGIGGVGGSRVVGDSPSPTVAQCETKLALVEQELSQMRSMLTEVKTSQKEMREQIKQVERQIIRAVTKGRIGDE